MIIYYLKTMISLGVDVTAGPAQVTLFFLSSNTGPLAS